MTPLDQQLHPEALRLVGLTTRLCVQTGCLRLCPGIYTLAILIYGPNSATRLIETLGGSLSALLEQCRDALPGEGSSPVEQDRRYFEIRLDPACETMAQATERFRAASRASQINAIHLLLGSLNTDPAMAEIFNGAGIGLSALESAAPKHKPQEPAVSQKQTTRNCRPGVYPVDTATASTTSVTEFCVDLTAMAANGKLDPLIGRERELDRIITILSRRRKNGPLLVGPQGTGKSTIVEGLAQPIVRDQVPQTLLSKRIHSIDLCSMAAGTMYRGQFEERIKAMLDMAHTTPDCILFIDEVHTLLGTGSAQGTLDVGNILKPALARGELTCIGATTESEYRKYFARDEALDRRFQRVLIDESTPQDTITILKGARPMLEQHHRCTIQDEALEAAVELSGRHVTDRFFPDKATNLQNQAFQTRF